MQFIKLLLGALVASSALVVAACTEERTYDMTELVALGGFFKDHAGGGSKEIVIGPENAQHVLVAYYRLDGQSLAFRRDGLLIGKTLGLVKAPEPMMKDESKLRVYPRWLAVDDPFILAASLLEAVPDRIDQNRVFNTLISEFDTTQGDPLARLRQLYETSGVKRETFDAYVKNPDKRRAIVSATEQVAAKFDLSTSELPMYYLDGKKLGADQIEAALRALQ